MMTPSMVRAERTSLRRMAREGDAGACLHGLILVLRPGGSAAALDRGVAAVGHDVVGHDPPVAEGHDAVRPYSAMSGSWVMSTMVMPRSRFRRCRISMTSMLVRVSRLPVGSSARSISGSLTSARAMATRCCCPPESWLGVWCAAVAEAHGVEQALARSRGGGGAAWRSAAVEQGQLDVLERRRARQQVEVLEDEADLPVAQDRAAIAVEPGHVLALEEVVSRRSAGRAGR